MLSLQPTPDITRPHRLGEQIPLRPCTTKILQRTQFRSGLHPFHDAFQLHVLAQCDQGFDDLEAGRVEVEVCDEGAVHLEFGQG